MANRKTRITREQYKRFKRMDHKQMEDFIVNLYNEGYEDGKKAAEGFIQSITVDAGNGVKAKINITAKGIIKVARTKTDTSTYEA